MTIGWVTLDVGAQALVYDLQGRARIEEGPQRLFLWREKLHMLQNYIANQNEYIVVRHCDGRIEHKPGPCSVFRNHLIHESIKVETGISLDANEVLVVYRQDGKTREVTRSLKHGPTLFIPQANEWLHSFSWHGTDPNNKTRMVPGICQFTKLKVIPDQFYYNVDEVRTADDALMRVKLMIFYELRDIEKMLSATSDPIADFINCVCADVVAFASKLTYMEFIERSGELNNMKNYPQLNERCDKIGYEVSKVVFRGYFASEKLQKMHDGAIEARSRLKIAYEQEEQKQDLTDMTLRSELERATLEKNLELEQLQHKHKMELSQQKHKIELSHKEHEDMVQRIQKEEEAKLMGKVALDEQKLAYWEDLHGLGVDITHYLVSQNPQPEKVIRVVAKEGTANLHLHQTN